jgi:hypothetical protein
MTKQNEHKLEGKPTISEELYWVSATHNNPVQKIAHRGALEIERLTEKVQELENAEYINLAYELCSILGVNNRSLQAALPMAIENAKRLIEAKPMHEHCIQATYTLTANLCAINTVSEKDGVELIRRESAMDLIMAWRMSMDNAQAVGKPVN